ncbi:similar to Saccharomyces cerevisiae YLL009C COX17 Copper metallochaperone that transfers copper to Sco1p and Cox11p for eventual delivery to cytochrome c oxidase [Maudiozyma saulgeensis]|uniref:Similar to Saccharomyces cerevisiae YLL009C COX17 Copper metallochaperone that transfers copper to Sco1p and Cox11p for eventual delivery to cytochrome c oxidase n=1 Tax=Maudiozyma saulgeensis TaxID=1789683 RepID=A0A1X7R7F7_9SACH|nr:similar to Saccharomyces cerevisiae YLL009C COX17 Copper metallochaperone that transfers copper to Sco1p and Cox11p for eventual delivery to cytochrome c oxidase [Kazachstania saulgeensis]
MAEVATKDTKPVEDKPKPCCVCKPEKEVRDQCLLFNGTEGKGSEKCKEFIEKYKQCMKGYGFEI